MRIVWLALATLACTGENPARDEIDARRGAPAAPATAADWTCPMHPEVGAHEPGSCPTCGMPLVRRGK